MFTFWRPVERTRIDVLCAEFSGLTLPGVVRDELQVILPSAAVVVRSAGESSGLAGPDAIIVVNQHTLCALHARDGLSWQAEVLTIGGDLIPPGTWFPSPALRDDELRAEFAAIFSRFRRPIHNTDSEDELRRALTSLVARHAGPRPTVSPELSIATNGVRRLFDYLRANPTSPLTLGAMSRIAGVSKYHLVRVFHEQYGIAPRAYHMRVRFARALALVAMGMPLSRVTYDAGFADQSHLTRRFREYIGMTPRQYRRQVTSHTLVRPADEHLASPAGVRGA
jgi:AraC-like DNA-binding protein